LGAKKMFQKIKSFFKPQEVANDEEVEKARVNLCKLFNEDPENPYLGANMALSSLAREYDYQRKQLVVMRNILLFLVVFFVSTTVYLAATQKVVPYVVEINQNGQVFDLNHSMKLAPSDIKDKIAVTTISEFIRYAFSVSPDGDVDIYNNSKATSYTRGSASSFLKEYWNLNDPKDIAAQYIISVDINYVLPISDDTTTVSWTKSTRDVKSNTLIAKQKYIGQFTYSWDKRSGIEIIDKYNPFGFYINYIVVNKDQA
jgi:type IV secretory pathway TrbF-like protein